MTKGKSLHLKINAFGYFGLLMAWTFPIIFGIGLLQDIFDKPFSTTGLIGALCILGLFSIPSVIVTYSIFWQSSTDITDIGITRKFFRQRITIRWDEIENVESTIFKLTLITKNKRENINLVLFKNSDEIGKLINLHLENSKTTRTLFQ